MTRKQTILAAALLAISANAAALDCSPVGRLAEMIMSHRQEGTSIDVVIEAIRETSDGKAESRIVQMAVEAYGTPRFTRKKNQVNVIGEFRDQAVVECHRTLGGN